MLGDGSFLLLKFLKSLTISLKLQNLRSLRKSLRH
jgi:hypothetical protein